MLSYCEVLVLVQVNPTSPCMTRHVDRAYCKCKTDW